MSIGNISCLPRRLVLKIIGFLDLTSKHCLHLMNRYVHHAIVGNKEELRGCEKWVIMAFLEQEALNRLATSTSILISERRKSNFKIPFIKRSGSTSMPENIEKLTCSFFKVKHRPDSFLKGGNQSTADLLQQPSLQRVCAWQKGKLFRVKIVETTASKLFDRWVSSMQITFLHCGIRFADGKCGCGEIGIEKCDVCPKVAMRVYDRLRHNVGADVGADVAIAWSFKKSADGELSVWDIREESHLFASRV